MLKTTTNRKTLTTGDVYLMCFWCDADSREESVAQIDYRYGLCLECSGNVSLQLCEYVR